ncbi:group I truncated hemoglobin [Rhodovulum sp. YNF3179]|uniref:group I truncated hemoglobin n=1 Tax=Rhodovulum sp. YNF3179 TaxID=3425127 RepID=UPI003D34CAD0
MAEPLLRELSTVSLYERLGGASGVRRLVDEIVEAHMRNPVIKARFLPYREDPDRLDATKQQLCAFFAAGSGGPESYTGRSMPEAHRGMNIGEAEYMAATDDILSVMESHGYHADVRKDVLAIVYALKDEIMRA